MTKEERLLRLLRRFVTDEDMSLGDKDLVRSIFRKWSKFWDIPLIDPNE